MILPKLDPTTLTSLFFSDCLYNHPETLLIKGVFRERYPHMGECECSPCSRIEKPWLRKALETHLIEKIRAMHNIAHSLRIASIGAGGCFQELVILGHLLKQGYRLIEMTLIDPCFEERIPNRLYCSLLSFEEFQKCVEEQLLPLYPDALIQLKYQTKFEIDQIEAMPQIVLLIDLQNERDAISQKPLLKSCLDMIVKHSGIPNDTLVALTNPSKNGPSNDSTCCDYICLTKKEYVINGIAPHSMLG